MRGTNDDEGQAMESNEFSIELESVELGDPNSAATDLIEFDDLDTITMPASNAANNYGAGAATDAAAVEITIEEVSMDLDDGGLEIELGADDIDALLTKTDKRL